MTGSFFGTKTIAKHIYIPYWYLISRVFNLAFFVIAKNRYIQAREIKYSIHIRGGSRGRVLGVRPPPSPEMTCSFLIQLVFCQKKTVWFIGVEVEQETSAHPPKKNPGSAPEYKNFKSQKKCLLEIATTNTGYVSQHNC